MASLTRSGRHNRRLPECIHAFIGLLLLPEALIGSEAFRIVKKSSAPLSPQTRPSAPTSTPLWAATNNIDGNAANPIGTVTILVPSSSDSTIASKSRFNSSPPLSYHDAAHAISEKVDDISSNRKGRIIVSICAVLTAAASSQPDIEQTRKLASEADVLIGLGLNSPYDVRFLSTLFRERRLAEEGVNMIKGRRCQFALDCDKPFAPIVGPYDEANPTILVRIPWSNEAKGRQTMYEMMSLFQRWTVEDFGNALLLFFDRFS